MSSKFEGEEDSVASFEVDVEIEHWSAMQPAARNRRRESSAVVVVLLVDVLTVGLVYKVVRSEWMNLKSDSVVCRELSEDLVYRRRASANDELQIAGDVYLMRSLPSEKWRRAICRS